MQTASRLADQQLRALRQYASQCCLLYDRNASASARQHGAHAFRRSFPGDFLLWISPPAHLFYSFQPFKPMLLAFSIVSQILSLTMINTRLPAFTTTTPTIRKRLVTKKKAKDLEKCFLVKFAGFNLCATGFLFILSLLLRKISQSSSNIPPPRLVERLVSAVERILPMPSIETKDAQDSSGGTYSRVAHAFNNLTFALFTLVYLIVIIFTFIF